MKVHHRHGLFVGAFAAAALVCLGAAALLNYSVDPAHLFDTSHAVERTVALLLTTGNVGGVSNCDERLLQKYRLEIGPVAPVDVVIMGSSRSMQIRSEIVHGRSLNLSVSGASIEDDVAILEMASAVPARSVILGVDPWLFNVNNDQIRWKSLAIEYARGLKQLDQSHGAGVAIQAAGKGLSASRLSQLFNAAYTVASIRTLVKSFGAKPPTPFLKKDDSPEPDSDAIRPDGSRVYSSRFQRVGPEQVRDTALAQGDEPIYSMARYVTIDAERLQILRSLIRRLKGRSEVALFLPPYHPATYDKIVRAVPIIHDVEETLRTLAREEQVKVLGSFDPRKVGCQATEFYDGMHPRDGCLSRIFGP